MRGRANGGRGLRGAETQGGKCEDIGCGARLRTMLRLRVEQAVDHDESVQQHRLRQVLLAREAEAQQVVAQVVSTRDARHGHRVKDGGKDVLGARDLVVALADDALEQQARRVHHRH